MNCVRAFDRTAGRSRRSTSTEIPAPSALYVFDSDPFAISHPVRPSPQRASIHPIAADNVMPRAQWYSPQLRRDVVSRLYHLAKAERVPMTRLVDQLVNEALARRAPASAGTARVAEEPNPPPPE